MAEPFLSEVRMMSFNFAPRGWAWCDGQLLPINQNQALYALLGTTFGGDGRVNFALPDLRGRVPVHVGAGLALGERGGASVHALTPGEAGHAHDAKTSTAPADRTDPAGNVWAVGSAAAYGDVARGGMSPTLVGAVGGSQAHNNLQPFTVLSFCIALQGIFPSST